MDYLEFTKQLLDVIDTLDANKRRADMYVFIPTDVWDLAKYKVKRIKKSIERSIIDAAIKRKKNEEKLIC